MKKLIGLSILLVSVLSVYGQTFTVSNLTTEKLSVAEWVKKDSILMSEEFPTHLTFFTDSTANFYKSNNPPIVALHRSWKFSHKDELICIYADAEEGVTVWQSKNNSLSVTLSDWNKKLEEVSVNGVDKKSKPKYVWYFSKEE